MRLGAVDETRRRKPAIPLIGETRNSAARRDRARDSPACQHETVPGDAERLTPHAPKHLSLTNFRNFARLDLEIPARAILLVGSNAQGKTSVLEAIYFLASFSSFQTHSDRQLVNFVEARNDLAVARLVAEYERNGQSTASKCG